MGRGRDSRESVCSHPVTVARPAVDRCPGLSRPFIADDGALVRLRVPGGQIATLVLQDLVEIAAAFGAPCLQLTSRGNLQLRALPDPIPEGLAWSIEATGLIPSGSHELVRNILAAPLASHLGDLVADFDAGLCADPELANLPGRFMVAFSDESGSVLGEHWDLAYQLTSPTSGRLLAAAAGHVVVGAEVARSDAVAELLRRACLFLTDRVLADHSGNGVWNVRDLHTGASVFEGLSPVTLDPPTALAAGTHDHDLVCGVPLGMLDAVMIDALAQVTDTVVLTPWRSVVVPRFGRDAEVAEALAASGLTTAASSPWDMLSACVGSPSCRRTHIQTMALAREAVLELPQNARRVHVSGCDRRCGAPAQEHIDVIGPTSALSIVSAAAPPVAKMPTPRYDYVRDGQEIYRRSFGMIRNEATLAGLDGDLATVATRIIHASGDTALVHDIKAHPDVIQAAREALRAGNTILTDSNMLASGITWRRLPAGNEVICLLRDPQVPPLAKEWQTTRAAAAVSLWEPYLEGAVVAIGNAPTALFHLLEMLHDGAPRPAAIIGMPVGFIGSAESKVALAVHELADGFSVPWMVLHGRRGGSAVAASAVNAIATPDELA